MNLTEACQTLAVSRSGYHAHKLKHRRPRLIEDTALAAEVHTAFQLGRHAYGAPRIRKQLHGTGRKAGTRRISRLMRQQGLRVQQKRRFLPRTTITDKDSPIAANLLLKAPAPHRLNQVWVTDITYLPTKQGWLYLAAEMDLYSRRIIGWSTHHTLETLLPAKALEKALATRGPQLDGLLHHSDRGCQYTSAAFRSRLSLSGITQSMSRSGNCYDNAAIESFWASLKAECFSGPEPLTHAQANSMLFDYIETFYNPSRLHSSLGYLSPIDFENSLNNN
jgi:transposase InsO family protein